MTLEEAEGTGKCVRLLLVEDYEPWRLSVRSMLLNLREVQVIGEVSDGLAAVQQSQVLQPDLILLDIGLPMLNGIEAARRIREVSAASKILFVSENRSWDVAEEALRSGGSGYVLKSKAASELLPAVEAVLQGKPFLSVGLTDLDPINLKDKSATHRLENTSREVRLYPDDAGLVNGFARSIKDALNDRSVVVVAATESQRTAILHRLNTDGVDVEDAVERKLCFQLGIADSSTDGNGFALPYGIEEMRAAKERNLRAAVG